MRHPILLKETPILLKGAPVLVAEDDLLQALDIAESLKEAGATVIGPVSRLDDALLLVRRGKCSAAILDFRLGDANIIPLGQELFRRNIPFVIHTGYDCTGVLPGQWRGCKLIWKPANIRYLVQTVAALVRWTRCLAYTFRETAQAHSPF